MPELPEVEVVRRGLVKHLPGRTLQSFRTDGKSLRWPVPETLMRRHLPGQVLDVKRRAKYLLIELDSGTLLIIHLGMTGKLGLFPASSKDLPHDHVFWQLDNGLELRFNDTRRFGSIAVIPPDQVPELEETFFHTTGPEPFAEAFNAAYLKKTAGKRKLPVKSFIMDTRVVAGVGNIYANESLFAARIRPTQAIGTIGLKRWQRLVEEIRKILERAIDCGGSTISDFFGTEGESGYFQVNFAVYGKADQACPRCPGTIQQIKLNGRATFYCPRCQR